VLDAKQFVWPPKSQPSRRIKEPRELNPSFGAYKQLESSLDVFIEISLWIISSVSDISSNDWDACASDATGPEKFNPFISVMLSSEAWRSHVLRDNKNHCQLFFDSTAQESLPLCSLQS
ncbi:unnamed protein product, partial [Musa textilis]